MTSCKECQYKKCCRNQCRMLSPGQSCGSCQHFGWCKHLYNVEAGNTECIMAPPVYEPMEGGDAVVQDQTDH